MRAVGLGKDLFGAQVFMSQGPVRNIEPAVVVPPSPVPLETGVGTGTLAALGTIAVAVGFAIFSVVRK